MADALFFGGLGNIVDPIIGFQLYIWLWAGIVVLSIFAYIGLYYGGWKPYAPLHGLYWAWKYGSNAAFIFDADLIGEMVDEKTAKCIFDYSKEHYELEGVPPRLMWIYQKLFYYPTAYLDTINPIEAIVFKFGGVNKDVEIARHLQKGEWDRSPSVVCGGVPVDIVVDTDNWTIRTSPQHKAIERCCRIWNEASPTNQIHSYAKFQRYLHEGKIVCPEVKLGYMVSWTRLDSGFPTEIEESEYAGKKRQMAEVEFNADQMTKDRMAVWVFIGAMGLAGLILAIRLLTHYVH